MQMKKVFGLMMLTGTLTGSVFAPIALAQIQRVDMRVEGMT